MTGLTVDRCLSRLEYSVDPDGSRVLEFELRAVLTFLLTGGVSLHPKQVIFSVDYNGHIYICCINLGYGFSAISEITTCVLSS